GLEIPPLLGRTGHRLGPPSGHRRCDLGGLGMTRDHNKTATARRVPIRVAHVAVGLSMGGTEKLLLEFARHIDRDRFELRFLALETRGTVADEIEACGWPVTRLAEPPGLRMDLIFRLARFFRRWGVDVVHTHNSKPLIYGGPAAWLAGAR